MKYLRLATLALRRVRVGERFVLLFIILLAFALRVYRLGAQALWWDESLSVYRATRDLATVLANTILIQNIVTTDTLPQCYFLLLHFLVPAFGISEFALRFLSVAANVATIPLLYVLARRWLTPTPNPSPVRRGRGAGVGVIAALLGAFSPFYVWYAQEARPYALVLFWSTLAVYALTRSFPFVIASPEGAKQSPGNLGTPALHQTHDSATLCRALHGVNDALSGASVASSHPFDFVQGMPLTSLRMPLAMTEARRWLAVYLLAAIAALYTHYYAIFFFPFHAILIALLVWQTPHRRWLLFLPAFPLASVIFLIPQITASAAGNTATGPYFVPLGIILRDLLNSFSLGVTVDLAQVFWIDLALLVLFLIGVVVPISNPSTSPSTSLRTWLRAGFQSPTSKIRISILLLSYIFVPIAALQVLSYVRPLYQNSRYLIALSPAFYLGVAAGIVALARRWRILALPALAVFLIGATISLNNLYFDPHFGKDDHRAWAEYLRERVRPGDFLILNSPHTEELYRYYADDLLPMTTLPILRADGVASPDADLAAVRDVYRRGTRVWYLAMHVPFDDPQARIEKLLNQEGVLLDQARFPGTSTEISLSLFAQSLPTANARDIRHPLNVAFAGNLRLLGYDAPEAIESGGRGVVKLYWQIDEPVGEDYAVSLRVVDDMETRWGQWDAIPLGNRTGSSTWQPKQVIVDVHDLPVVAGTPPGKYRVQVQPYHSATGNALGDVMTLGEIQVTSPR